MIGARLGRWILGRELGHGGMGQVYLAHEADHPEQLAAVKVLARELSTHSGAVSRFEREIDVLRTLQHPNIVRFYESGAYEGLLYYVMEYVEGHDFADLLEQQGRLPWEQVLTVAIQVCAALKHAHDHGVIHRDLKPSNLLRGHDERIYLTDFGVAHVFAAKHLTRAGAVVGTAEYLSPEQAEGKPATRRSDLYSLGCVLYTLLCGRTPFQGEDVLDLLHKHRYARFDPPRKFVLDLPPEFDEIVCQLMEKDPEKRPPDAGVLHRRLEAVRRRLSRRGEPTMEAISGEATQMGDTLHPDDRGPKQGEGPATLMSRLLRRELEAQNRGGPLWQFLNRPIVLVVLFILCAGTLLWTFWPVDAEEQFQQAQALLESDNPEDWTMGWQKLEKVRGKLENGPHAADVRRYEQQIEDYRKARISARRSDHLSEAQWFYEEGLRRRQQGRLDEAKETWRDLIRAFREVPAERWWVRLAEKELAKDDTEADAQRWDSVNKALERVRKLREEGKQQEASDLCTALDQLYRDDPSAKAILEKVRSERGP